MWLLNVETLGLEEFVGLNIPAYGILSHTWGAEEVTFVEMKKPRYREAAKHKAGFHKIRGCCRQAQKDGFAYAWIDSCCIDKRSSTELSEALNSMFQWYKMAARCYVYLSDVPNCAEIHQMFGKSRWFTRGWTLQELLAPRYLLFFAQDWEAIGYKASAVKGAANQTACDHDSEATTLPFLDLTNDISKITEIPIDFLVGRKAIGQACLAQRMYWAARRETTRSEDCAYSLMGLFDINMPILYGEGLEKAFSRLQREIIHRSPDQSIFAWYDPHASSHRLLADSPACFRNSGAVTQMGRSQSLALDTSSNWSCFVMTNLGLQITLPLSTTQSERPLRYGDNAKAALHCVEEGSNENDQRIYLDLVFLNNDLEGRPVFMCHRFREWTLGVHSGIATNMFLCGNDYISALTEQKNSKATNVEAIESAACRFISILADEVGMTEDELTDDLLFPDIGVDSLMMIIIVARVREELNMDIGNDAFIKYVTIGAFKEYLTSGEIVRP
jgi:acyl carrier protein